MCSVGFYVSFKFSEPPVTGLALSYDHWPVRLPSCIGMFQDSILIFGLNPHCGVCVSVIGSKLELGL